MPAEQRGSIYKTARGFGIRWIDENGVRQRKPGFASRSAARRWFEDVERRRMNGEAVARPDVTFAAFVAQWLDAHAVGHELGTIITLRERLVRPLATFGDVPLRDLERRAAEVAAWRTTLPERSGYGIAAAFRQACRAAIRWGLMSENPVSASGPIRKPKPREVLAFERDEIDRLAVELGPRSGPLVVFAAETGLRPSEWIALERRDIDRAAAGLVVERTYAAGAVKGYGKTVRARRRVPLTRRALEAHAALPPRIDTPLLFPAPEGSHLRLGNWREREWYPALDAARLARRGPYALRHTFASHALAAGVGMFELARLMGTSAALLDTTYGHLLRGSDDSIRARLEAAANRFGQDLATAEDEA